MALPALSISHYQSRHLTSTMYICIQCRHRFKKGASYEKTSRWCRAGYCDWCGIWLCSECGEYSADERGPNTLGDAVQLRQGTNRTGKSRKYGVARTGVWDDRC